MRKGRASLAVGLLSAALCGCGGGGGGGGGPTSTSIPIIQAAAPVVTTAPAQNGAQVITLSSATSGAAIYYTEDGSTPTASSPRYQAPFLVATNLTLQAVAMAPGDTGSAVTSQAFAPNITSGTLVWSDEFANATGADAQPNPLVWTYDTGDGGFGNSELETYCAWGAATAPCTTAQPSAYVGTDGYLHVTAQQTSPGVYTSARLKTQGLFGFRYGRFEVRAQVPEGQGLWPAVWLMGENIATVSWPACGEQDVLERVNGALTPDWTSGSVHGTGFTSNGLGTVFNVPAGQTAAQWHTYGMIWSPGSISYYVDDPTKPYVTYTPASLSGVSGAVWPFDGSQNNFIIINLAVGGTWPGSPNTTTVFPSQMLVDYVRVYAN